MTTLLEKLRARRETWVQAGKFEFKLRRPTRLEIQKMPKEHLITDVIVAFVCDWKNVTEDDLVGGGGSTVMPFDVEVWQDWIADRYDLWPPIIAALNKSLTEYSEQQEALAKN